MKRSGVALLGMVLYLGSFSSNIHAADQEAGAKAAEVTFTGTFEWSRKKGKKHNIKGVFTPDGANKWKVIWTFKWGKGNETYTGTAEGNLDNGPLKGQALRKQGPKVKKPDKRLWKFEGVVKNGELNANHTSSNGKPSGIITIKKT